MHHLTAPELESWLEDASRPRPVLLDVREGWEFGTCHIAGSTHMPMNSVPGRLGELDEDAPIICVCHHGVRSMQVASYLERNGFGKVTNLSGGIDAWANQVDPTMPQY